MEAPQFPARFYKSVSVENVTDDGWHILLDGHAVKTPGKDILTLPNRPFAEEVAAEWETQQDVINPHLMPLTRRRMVVIDRATEDSQAWRETVLAYLGSDLLCYHAERPADLVNRQKKTWLPYLDWLSSVHHVKLEVASGIIARQQPEDAISKAATLLEAATPDELSCVAGATEITGSAVLALALWQQWQPVEDLFLASRLDETYQADKMGSRFRGG